MNTATVIIGPVTFLIAHGQVPAPSQLPWGDEECDAFVALLDGAVVADELFQQIAEGLVNLNTDWVEAMGADSEQLHDIVDRVSVMAGRQSQVGDGSPMTTWDNDLVNTDAMVEYVERGGLGASDHKVIILIGPERAASAFVAKLDAQR